LGMPRGLCAVLSILITATVEAVAQPEAPPLIENEGVGIIEIEPDYAEFWLTKKAAGDSFEEAAKLVSGFEEALKAKLEELELVPYSTAVSGVSIPDIEKKEAVVSARLRFSLSSMPGGEDRVAAYGKLCDDVTKLAAATGAVLEGPFLGYGDEQRIEQQAVARATENALYKADAVASIMQSQIIAVQHVEIREVSWDSTSERVDTVPDIRRISCEARVLVSYLYGAY